MRSTYRQYPAGHHSVTPPGPIVPSWVTAQAVAYPDSLYHWDLGTNRTMTRRARTLQARMVAAGVPATLERIDTYAPGVWRLSFPVRDYRTAAAISDAFRIGDAPWGAERRHMAVRVDGAPA